MGLGLGSGLGLKVGLKATSKGFSFAFYRVSTGFWCWAGQFRVFVGGLGALGL